jgi:hypothetical protein
MWERLLAPVRGNPILTRHLATTFTGPRLGLAILLVSATLVTLYCSLFFAATYGGLSPGVTYLAHNGVLLGLLILLLPLKVSGVIEGPRINRAFDQIVVTGASPAVLFLGAWLSGLAYAALLLFVTIPFAACMVTFGDAEIATMFKGYLTLLAYSNVIIAVTLAFSVFGREWLAAPFAVVVLAAFSTLAFIPNRDLARALPPMLAELSPMRLLLTQSGMEDAEFQPLLLAKHVKFLLWPVDVDIARPILWTVLCAIGALLFTIGPGHRFSAGFDNFGAVVLKGDRKRGFLGRLRGGITRKVEMAFFYENAPRWTRRWGYFIRYTLTAVAPVLAWIMLIGGIWIANPSPRNINPFLDEKLIASICVGGGILAFWALLSSSGRHNMLAMLPVGRFKIRCELLLTGLFVGLSGLLLWFESLPVARVAELHSGGKLNIRRAAGVTPEEVDAYATVGWQLSTAMVLGVLNLFLIARLASRLSTVFIRVRVLAMLGFVSLLAVPAGFAALIHEGEVSPAFMPIANLCPVVLDPSFDRDVPGNAWEAFMTAHGVVAAVLATLLLIRYVPWRRVGSQPVAALVFGVLAGAGTLSGQDPSPKSNSPFRINSITRGFHGAAFSYGIDFYTAEVENTGDTTLTVRYWIEGFEERWGGESFVLSPRSKRTLRWDNPPTQRYNRWRGRSSDGNQVVFHVGSEQIRSRPLDLIHLMPLQQRGLANKKGSRPSEQHVFAGTKGSFPPAWLDLSHAGSPQNLAACPPGEFPVSARCYTGVEVVWMTAAVLMELNSQQQGALYHYLLLGGTVVFYGGLPGAELAGSGAWRQLLRPEAEWTSSLDGTQLRHVRLAESEDVLTATPEGGAAKLPLLNIRHVGAGHLAHMAFAPAVSKMPNSLRGDPEFWNEFDGALPRGGFAIVLNGMEDSWVSSDYTGLVLLGGYYIVYALGLSAGLFFFARRRRHRGRMWTQLVAVPILFLAFVPVLIAAANTQPSTCEFANVAFFHAGSTSGVSASHLLINSSGKRHHSISLRGEAPIVLMGTDAAWRHRYWVPESDLSRFRPIDLGGDGKGAWRFDCEISPWSVGELFLYDSQSIDEAVHGSARQMRGRVDVQVDVPESLRGRELFIMVLQNKKVRSYPVTADSKGRVKLSQPLTKRQNIYGRDEGWVAHRTFQFRKRGEIRAVGKRARVSRVVLVVAPPVPDSWKRPVGSEGFRFEREVSARTFERARKQAGGRRRIRKEGDRYIETLDSRLLAFEIPIVN